MEYPLRISGASVWVKCAASRRMSEGCADIGDTTVREEGTAFAWAALMTSLGHVVNTDTVAPNGVAITDAMLDSIDEYWDGIKQWPGKPDFELPLHAKAIHELCGGTTDVAAFSASHMILDVGDAKFGYRKVDVFENYQLLGYVCAMLDRIGVLDDRLITVRMWIYQPRCPGKSGAWSKWEVNAADLRAYFNFMRNAAAEAMSANPKITTGPHCNYCNGRVKCEQFRQVAATVLDMSGEAIANDLDAYATDAELVRIERAQEILDARKTAMAARAEMFARAGKQLAHYKMEGVSGRLKWKEGMEKAAIALGASFNVEIAKPQKAITPTQAMKLLPKEVVSAMSERPSNGLKLVRIDPNEARRRFTQ